MPDETQPEAPAPVQPRPKRRQGFACMTREQRSSIARLGGRAVQFAGTGHRWDTKTASEAGKLSRESDRRKKDAKAKERSEG